MSEGSSRRTTSWLSPLEDSYDSEGEVRRVLSIVAQTWSPRVLSPNSPGVNNRATPTTTDSAIFAEEM